MRLSSEGLLYSAKQVEEIDAEFEKNKAEVDRFRATIGEAGSGVDAGGSIGGGDCG